MLNNPKTREMLAGAAVQVNQKVRQSIESFASNEVAKAVAPLVDRIAELEARIAALEAQLGRGPAVAPSPRGQAAPSDFDPGNF